MRDNLGIWGLPASVCWMLVTLPVILATYGNYAPWPIGFGWVCSCIAFGAIVEWKQDAILTVGRYIRESLFLFRVEVAAKYREVDIALLQCVDRTPWTNEQTENTPSIWLWGDEHGIQTNRIVYSGAFTFECWRHILTNNPRYTKAVCYVNDSDFLLTDHYGMRLFEPAYKFRRATSALMKEIIGDGGILMYNTGESKI